MPRTQRPDPIGMPRQVTRAEALAAGITDGEIQSRLRAGLWKPLHPGVYLRSEEFHGDTEWERAETQHALEALAAARRIGDAAVGFGSAGLIHGMQLAGGVPSRRELIVPPGRWNGIRSGMRVRVASLDPVDLREVAGVPVTAPARTWVDIARDGDLSDALSAGDSALRLQVATPSDLADAIARHDAQRGLRKVERALAHLDPLRENPLESRSFAHFIQWGLPLPECQVSIYDDDGFAGRVDFLWREFNLIGEADGRLKYGAERSVYAEKVREDRMRADGFGFIRWGWNLDEALRQRLARLLLR